jgi:hypothetical protein
MSDSVPLNGSPQDDVPPQAPVIDPAAAPQVTSAFVEAANVEEKIGLGMTARLRDELTDLLSTKHLAEKASYYVLDVTVAGRPELFEFMLLEDVIAHLRQPVKGKHWRYLFHGCVCPLLRDESTHVTYLQDVDGKKYPIVSLTDLKPVSEFDP